VATGDQNVPRVPPVANTLPDWIAQQHTADTAELVCCQRAVFVDAGFYDQRPQDLPDPSMINASQPIVAAGGRSLSLQSLTRSGAMLVGRPLSMTGDSLLLDDSVEANITAGDVFAARVRTVVDEFIRQRGLAAPPSDPDDTDRPIDVNPPTALHLREEDINSVIWRTGFTGDFSWLTPELLDTSGLDVMVQLGPWPAPGTSGSAGSRGDALVSSSVSRTTPKRLLKRSKRIWMQLPSPLICTWWIGVGRVVTGAIKIADFRVVRDHFPRWG
jgi:hypothetical protein